MSFCHFTRSLLVLSFILLAACNGGKDPKDVVAKVNREKITRSDVDYLAKEMTSKNNGERPSDEMVIEELIRIELLRQEADKEGLTQRDSYEIRERNLKRKLAAEFDVENFFSTMLTITDSELRSIYQERIANTKPQQFRARHILLESQDKAEAIISELNHGARFEELARQSKDPTTRSKGGEIGWFGAHQTSPEIAEALNNMEPGDLTQSPIQSPYGWHVILLEEKRTVDAPSFDTVKEQVRTALKKERLQKHVEELLKKAKIERTETKTEAEAPAAATKP